MLVSYKDMKSTIKTELPTDAISPVFATEDYSDKQHDLVYHDYGTGVKLSKGSSLTIPKLDLNLDEETAIIYVMNLIDPEIIKLCDYQPMQNISYTPVSEGVYKIIADISNGDIVDLTPKAMIAASFYEIINDGIILLK